MKVKMASSITMPPSYTMKQIAAVADAQELYVHVVSTD